MVIMLQLQSLHPLKTLLISAIAISLAACNSTESTNTPNDSAGSPTFNSASPNESAGSPVAASTSSSPQPTESSTSVAIPGANNIKEIVEEINFKAAPKNLPNGRFDGLNNSSASKLEVTQATPVTARGWAILADESKLPDNVIITYGDNNSIAAVVPVNVERPDVAKVLKNPAYIKSGWSAIVNPNDLPAGEVVLKAWAYNSARKQATQLDSTYQLIIGK